MIATLLLLCGGLPQSTLPKLPQSTLPPAKATAYVSPAGYHRHMTTDGRIIEHSDHLINDPVAHKDVAWPWLKYTGPLPPTKQEKKTAKPEPYCPPGKS